MVEDVSREVKIMRALTGHKNLVQFYDAFEDDENVYIVMEQVYIYIHHFSYLICSSFNNNLISCFFIQIM